MYYKNNNVFFFEIIIIKVIFDTADSKISETNTKS